MKSIIFELRRTRNKQVRAYIIAGNGEVLFWSEPYKRRVDAVKAIRLVKLGSPYLIRDNTGMKPAIVE